MIRIRLRKDLTRLDRLEREVGSRTASSVLEAAQALKEDIRNSWSPISPSSPGSPPAVVSHTLDESIDADTTGRNLLGQFAAGDDVKQAFVRVGAKYGLYLEEGTYKMDPRPFVGPAVDRLASVYPEFFKDIFK